MFGSLNEVLRLVALFLIVVGVQHALMLIVFSNLFSKITNVPVLGKIVGVPVVFLHELFGHLIPAVLSGSSVTGIKVGEQSGNVQIRYEKNLFAFTSIMLAGFGPTFILPLLFLVAAIYAYSYDPVLFITDSNFVEKFAGLFSNMLVLDSPIDYVMLYLMVVLAPGAASSSGDLKSVLAFIVGAPLLTLICTLLIAGFLVLSGDYGFPLAQYATIVIANSFAVFLCIYLPSLLSMHIIVQGWKRGTYVHAVAGIVAGVAICMAALPQLGWLPVLGGLAFASIAVLAHKKVVDF